MIRRVLWDRVRSVQFYGIEGRAIIVRFDKTCLINVYTPNSGIDGLGRLNFRVNEWDKDFRELVKLEMSTRQVVVVGDLNVARSELDVHNPKNKKKSAGFTDQERESFERLLSETKLVDVWRQLHPSDRGYTYWSYMGKARDRDAGWRIDYILTSKESLADVSCEILSKTIGSDHAPVEINGFMIQ
jgi:exodeoxyribonuclease III